jgi:hypothetical protein
MPEYKVEIPNEKLIQCLDIINRKAGGSIIKRDLKDAAIGAGLIHVDEKRITTIARTKEEYSDQAAYMSLNKNLIAPLRNWKFITDHSSYCLSDRGRKTCIEIPWCRYLTIEHYYGLSCKYSAGVM